MSARSTFSVLQMHIRHIGGDPKIHAETNLWQVAGTIEVGQMRRWRNGREALERWGYRGVSGRGC